MTPHMSKRWPCGETERSSLRSGMVEDWLGDERGSKDTQDEVMEVD